MALVPSLSDAGRRGPNGVGRGRAESRARPVAACVFLHILAQKITQPEADFPVCGESRQIAPQSWVPACAFMTGGDRRGWYRAVTLLG
jgi:hypothetical protein